MASTVNKAVLLGNVGKDPEIKSFQNGGRIATFSLATSENWKDKATGERKEKVTWHRISVLNEPLVDFVSKYVKKGMKIYVEAPIENREWLDKDGNKKFSTEITLRPYKGELTIIDSFKNTKEETKKEVEAPSIDDDINF